MHQLVQFLPQRQRHAAGVARAFLRVLLQAGHGGEGSFHQFHNFADGVFLRFAQQHIAAAFPAGAFDEFSVNQFLHDNLKVLLGDPLPLGDILQRYRLSLIMFCQVNHHPERVTAFCGNHTASLRNFLVLIAYFTAG